MKSKIIVGFEFIIFLLLLAAVIIYSQVLIKKVIDTATLEELEAQKKNEVQQIEIVATTTSKNAFSVEEKYAWLEKKRALSASSSATSSESSVNDKKSYLMQNATSSATKKQWTVEEKMKFLEAR